MSKVNEKSTTYIEATFRDKSALPAAPASARYKIDCVTTNTEITSWTSITAPEGITEIKIKPSEVAILSDSNAQEIKRITVGAAYGANDTVYDEYDITVINLSGVNLLT